jgi:hypothetical protein
MVLILAGSDSDCPNGSPWKGTGIMSRCTQPITDIDVKWWTINNTFFCSNSCG